MRGAIIRMKADMYSQIPTEFHTPVAHRVGKDLVNSIVDFRSKARLAQYTSFSTFGQKF